MSVKKSHEEQLLMFENVSQPQSKQKTNQQNVSDVTKSTQSNKTGKLQHVELTQIADNPQHARRLYSDDSLLALAESIKINGILQPVVCTTVNKKLQLAIGHRRFKAAKMSGLEKIAVIVSDGNPNELSLLENVLREELTVVEEAEAFHALIVNCGYKQEDLSKKFGKAISTISEIIAVAKLPEAIRNDCRFNTDVPRDILVKISRQKSDETKFELYEEFMTGRLSREDLKKKPHKSISPKINAFSFFNSFSCKLTKLDEYKMTPVERVHAKSECEKIIEELSKLVAKLDSYINFGTPKFIGEMPV